MKYTKLISLLAKSEGKKHQASVGDVREIIKQFAEMEAAHYVETGDHADGPLDLVLGQIDKAIDKLEKRKK